MKITLKYLTIEISLANLLSGVGDDYIAADVKLVTYVLM